MATPASRLRQLLQRGIVRLAGVHDAIGAQVADQVGFCGLWCSGLGISSAHGVHDCSNLPLEVFVEAARTVARSSDLPVLADADSGFGDMDVVGGVVRTYEDAGVAGLCIEDAPFPKRNSFFPGRHEVIEAESFAAKIRAARAARRDPSFLVVARTEAFIAGHDLEATLARCRLYADAGADMVVPHSRMRSCDEVLAFARRWDRPVPLGIIPSTYTSINDCCSDAQLQALGIRAVVYANQALRASIRAQREALQAILHAGSASVVEERIASIQEIFALQDGRTPS